VFKKRAGVMACRAPLRPPLSAWQATSAQEAESRASTSYSLSTLDSSAHLQRCLTARQKAAACSPAGKNQRSLRCSLSGKKVLGCKGVQNAGFGGNHMRGKRTRECLIVRAQGEVDEDDGVPDLPLEFLEPTPDVVSGR
jgi:hypothetical protein